MTTTTHPQTRSRIADLVALLGPDNMDALTGTVRPLTAAEEASADAYLARYHGDPVAALGVTVPDDVAAIMRGLFGGAR